jgi:hypothetical protein
VIRANRASLSIRSDSLTHDDITAKLEIAPDDSTSRELHNPYRTWSVTYEDDGLSEERLGSRRSVCW